MQFISHTLVVLSLGKKEASFELFVEKSTIYVTTRVTYDKPFSCMLDLDDSANFLYSLMHHMSIEVARNEAGSYAMTSNLDDSPPCTVEKHALEQVDQSRTHAHAMDGGEDWTNDDEGQLNENNMNYFEHDLEDEIQWTLNSYINNDNAQFEDSQLRQIDDEDILNISEVLLRQNNNISCWSKALDDGITLHESDLFDAKAMLIQTIIDWSKRGVAFKTVKSNVTSYNALCVLNMRVCKRYAREQPSRLIQNALGNLVRSAVSE